MLGIPPYISGMHVFKEVTIRQDCWLYQL